MSGPLRTLSRNNVESWPPTRQTGPIMTRGTWPLKAGAGGALQHRQCLQLVLVPWQVETVDGVQTVLSTFNGNYPGLEG